MGHVYREEYHHGLPKLKSKTVKPARRRKNNMGMKLQPGSHFSKHTLPSTPAYWP